MCLDAIQAAWVIVAELFLSGFGLFEGVIGGAHQRAGFDVFEAHRSPRTLNSANSSGWTKRTIGRCSRVGCKYWPSVRMCVPCAARFFHGGENFVAFSSPRPSINPVFVGTSGCACLARAQQFERALVDRAFAHLAIEARHGFHVVIQHVGPRRQHSVERVPIAAKIGDQHFHFAAGDAFANLFDRARENVRRRRRADRRDSRK